MAHPAAVIDRVAQKAHAEKAFKEKEALEERQQGAVRQAGIVHGLSALHLWLESHSLESVLPPGN